jgi:hypothetical protein
VRAVKIVGNPVRSVQDLPDGPRRAWQSLALQAGSPGQIIQDGFGAGRAVQRLGWLVANGQNLLDHR